MERNGSQLIVPVGRETWNALKYRETMNQVFLFWEQYMSKIAPFLFSEELDEEEMTDIIFKYRNQTKRFEAYSAGSSCKTLEILIDKKGKKKIKTYFTFNFNLERINKGYYYEDIPSQPQGKTVFEESEAGVDSEEVTEFERRDYRNPWPRFISTPMGGMTKWKRR